MTSDTSTIHELEARRYKAMIDCDLATLDQLLSDDLIYTHSDGRADSKESYMAGLSSGDAVYRGVDRTNERIIPCGDAAIVQTDLLIDYLGQGQERLIKSRAMAVWSRKGGDWQLFAVQSASAA